MQSLAHLTSTTAATIVGFPDERELRCSGRNKTSLFALLRCATWNLMMSSTMFLFRPTGPGGRSVTVG
jgi:hypothetical protein